MLRGRSGPHATPERRPEPTLDLPPRAPTGGGRAPATATSREGAASSAPAKGVPPEPERRAARAQPATARTPAGPTLARRQPHTTLAAPTAARRAGPARTHAAAGAGIASVRAVNHPHRGGRSDATTSDRS
eukprot:7999512-Alexandrium_andersonii.AAC.1